MQVKGRSPLVKAAIDVFGVLAIIGSVLTGPIPGPGGIPLLILGLSLLATNHEWAERLLLTVKKHGVNLGEKIFSDNPKVKALLDLASIVLIAGAVYLVTFATRSILKTAAVSLVFMALLLFLGNRNRLKNLKKNLKHKLKKQ